MEYPDIIIAVDGCSSTGKSSFARALAATLGFLYLDSGALYRTVTLFAREQGLISRLGKVDPALEGLLPSIDIHFNADGKACIGPRCVDPAIRTMEVSSLVSPVSALPYVRQFVDSLLHRFGSAGRIVMDGRDIGTTVFPDAQLKIFMTASEEVRARRRYDELVAKGEHPSLEEVVANLRERDYIDSHRETSPLRQAPDAFVLDNSSMSIPEEVAWTLGLIRGRFDLVS